MNEKKLSEVLREAALLNPTYIELEDGKRDQMVVMSVDLIETISRLEKENNGLKAVCGIIKSAVKADYEYNTGLLKRLLEMQETSFDGIHEGLQWRLGSRFQVLDSEGAHDPVYIVSPNGECFELNHFNDDTTDLARAHFMVDALNEAWDKIRTPTT